MTRTYLTVTINVTDQRISDKTPSRSIRLGASAKVDEKT
jgi:hypothetical protein